MSRPLALGPWSRSLLAGALSLALGVVIGAALGWLSWRFWVIGLFGVVAGLAVGWALAVATLWLGRVPAVRSLAALALAASWLTLQVFEDHNQRLAYRTALAETRAAETGLPPEEVARLRETGGLDYLADDGDDILEGQVVKAVGFGGPAGRWVFRGQGGVRLAGDHRSGRALPVGIVGFVVATLLELGLALFLALRIVRRAARAAEAPVSR